METKSSCCDQDSMDQIGRPDASGKVSRDDVKEFYSEAGATPQPGLCCPTIYKKEEIDHIPKEVMEVSYGCGSPVTLANAKKGETFVDLGAGGGVDCFIASRLVGKEGKVIGIDMTPEMMVRATKNASLVADRLGYNNTEFRYGFLEKIPVDSDTVDLVTSNCVVNLAADKKKVMREVFRIVKNGGRFVISDIVAEKEVPAQMKKDKELWGECISGALTEKEFIDDSAAAGFYGLEIIKKNFYREVEGEVFWSVTLQGWKAKKGEKSVYVGQTATYLGPFSEIKDDEDHTFVRNVPQEICTDTALRLSKPPYQGQFTITDPTKPLDDAECCPPAKGDSTSCCTPEEAASGCCDGEIKESPVSIQKIKSQKFPSAPIDEIKTLWFQVAGTLCNLECSHCLVSASPANKTHEMMTLAQIKPHLKESKKLGVKEYYFTGGEPFMNREMVEIIEETLTYGPVTVLTNATFLSPALAKRLMGVKEKAKNLLELRISMDGTTPETNDPIRGKGTFKRIMEGIKNVSAVGIEPIVTVTMAAPELQRLRCENEFKDLMTSTGIKNPRVKILELFKIGNEEQRTSGYQDCQTLAGITLEEGKKEKLQCIDSRMVTGRGVWVCPILVNEPGGKMGETIEDTLKPFPLTYGACHTCYVSGVTCRTE